MAWRRADLVIPLQIVILQEVQTTRHIPHVSIHHIIPPTLMLPATKITTVISRITVVIRHH